MSATDEIITFVQNLDYGVLTSDVISQARRCVLDMLGVAIAGSQTGMAQISTRFATDQFRPGEATLIGSAHQLCEVGATWVNGICASALDMDDGHRLAMGHPGAAVIPTALAVAETGEASGRDFLAAIVAGYEVAVRASTAMLPDYRAGRYSTGIWGGFGSVAAAGLLLGFDRQTFQDALGVVAAHGPSPPRGAFLHDSMVKETIPWAGVAGCSAAFLARQGFSGPRDVLDRSNRYDTTRLVKDLGKQPAILKTYFKPYASCRWSHAAIDGALELAREYDIQPEQIKRIHVEGFEAITMLADYAPANTVAAQYSIPFSVALALTHKRIGPAQLSQANLQEPSLLDLARKVSISVAPELDRLFPEKTATRVTLSTDRGEFTTTVEYPKGDPANPMSEAELEEKFRWLAVNVVGEERAQRLIEAVAHLDQMNDVRHLTRLLAFTHLQIKGDKT
ncbi:MAG: MmgE/PrpD family protein [Anaerolineae bacterium]